MSCMRTPSRDAAARSITHVGLQAALLAVGGDVDELRQRLQPVVDASAPSAISSSRVRAPQRELVAASRTARPPARTSCAGNMNTRMPGIALQLRPQPVDHVRDALSRRSAERLQADEQLAVVDRGAERRRRRPTSRRRRPPDRPARSSVARCCSSIIAWKEMSGEAWVAAEDQAGVVLREEALRRLDVERDGQRDGGDEHQQRQRTGAAARRRRLRA